MKKEYEDYMNKKKTNKKLKSEDKLEELEELYRKVIMAKIGKELVEVQDQHKELSLAFGFPIGIARTLNFTTTSILDVTSNILSLISQTDSIDPELFKGPCFKENAYVEYFLSFLTVISSIQL